MPRKKSPPSYRLHKARNCAVVTIAGKNHYLGPYGSPKSREKYAQLIAEWARPGSSVEDLSETEAAGLSINELVARYWSEYVQVYYTQDGKPTDRQYHIRIAFRVLCGLYGSIPAREFGPRKLKAVRDEMIRQRVEERGRVSRGYVNDHVGIIKRLFRWAVGEELIPVAVYQALKALESIRKGRDPRVTEAGRVLPAPDQAVQAVIGVVSPQLRTMIELQLLTGMRPDEVTIMRPRDIDRSGRVWQYRPESHKTEHLGFEKVVLLGPKAQVALSPWLDRDPDTYLFDPREVVRAKADESRRRNKRKRTRRRTRRSRPIREHYDDESYCQAVTRACEKAGVARWTPGQLRHNAATRIRQQHGLEAARLILGHQSMATTEIYAEKDLGEAAAIMEKLG